MKHDTLSFFLHFPLESNTQIMNMMPGWIFNLDNEVASWHVELVCSTLTKSATNSWCQL